MNNNETRYVIYDETTKIYWHKKRWTAYWYPAIKKLHTKNLLDAQIYKNKKAAEAYCEEINIIIDIAFNPQSNTCNKIHSDYIKEYTNDLLPIKWCHFKVIEI